MIAEKADPDAQDANKTMDELCLGSWQYKEQANSKEHQGNETDDSTMTEQKAGLKYKLNSQGDEVQVEQGGETENPLE